MAFSRRGSRWSFALGAIGAVLCAAALLAFTATAARADDRNLILTDKSRQSAGDIDFTQPPVWKTPVACDVRDLHDGCRLARMTAEPTGTAPSEIVATAMRIARRIDASRDQSTDGYSSLRAAEAYLVAAVYEAQSDNVSAARELYKLVLSRAGDVPRSMTKFQQTYTIVRAMPSVSNGYSVPSTVQVGATSKEEPDRYYAQAQLVREYANRAIANLANLADLADR
jgi:hypothetical protein